MTPQQKIKWLILALQDKWDGRDAPAYPLTVDDERAFDLHECRYQEATYEIRASGTETDLPCSGRGYCEAKAVAAKLPDGSWVGWTYYYGGGKHGQPEEMPWIDGAYDVSCVEQEIVAIHRTFAVVTQLDAQLTKPISNTGE